jgi:hypothetical protein
MRASSAVTSDVLLTYPLLACLISFLSSEVQSLVENALWVPIVELTEDEGKHLLQHVTDPSAMVQAELVDRPEVLELWGILDKLQNPDGWPNGEGVVQDRRGIVSEPEQAWCGKLQPDETLSNFCLMPADKKERRRLFQYLKQRHNPDAAGGSVCRYKYLVQAYERLTGGGFGAAQVEL